MTNQTAKLTGLVEKLRTKAEPVGSLHGTWDLIFEIEGVLNGHESKWTENELIAMAEELVNN